MTAVAAQPHQEANPQGPKFFVNIEGTEYPWDEDTITVPQIRTLGSLPSDVPVLEINLQDNTERTLAENETVELKPGHGFAKKVRYQRG
jgi:Multiubiquitin